MFPPHIIELATQVLAKAREKKWKIATAESCTGGLLAGALTEIPGSSDAFEYGFVTYANEAKSDLVGVDPKLIAKHGAVSLEVAQALARGAAKRASADFGVGITGIAGPGGGTAEKPVGMVCIAVDRLNIIDSETGLDLGGASAMAYEFGDIGRHQVRMKSVETALMMLVQAITANSLTD